MSRETLKNFLGSIGKSADKIDYVIDSESGAVPPGGQEPAFNSGDDLGKDPNTGLPLIEEGSSITGDYVKYITSTNKNLHNFNAGNLEGSRYTLGQSLTLSNNSSVKDPFLPPNQEPTNYSNSNYIGDNSELQQIVDKKGEEPGKNSEMLKSIAGRSASQTNQVVVQSVEQNEILKKIQEMRSEFNRFDGSDSDEVFKDNNYNLDDFNDENFKPGTYTSQSKLGAFDKDVVTKSVISNDKLKDVGRSILLSAGGWDRSGGQLDPSSYEINQDSIPELTPGMKVAYDNIKARNSFNAPTDNLGNSTRQGKNEPYREISEVNQSIYNENFKFSSMRPEIARLMCANSLISIFDLLGELINSISKISDTDRVKDLNNYNGTGPHVLGSYRVSNDAKIDFIAKNLLIYTDYKFSDCFAAGIEICFGLEYKEGKIITKPKEAIIKKNTQMTELTNFWTNVSFSLLRRSQNVLKKYSEINSNTFINDFLTIINELRTSSIIGLINTMASIGNISLKQRLGNKDIKTNKKIYSPYDVDSIKDSPGTRVHKSRKKSGFTLLESSLSERSTTSMYLLPPNITKAAMDMGNLVSGQNPAKGMLGSSLASKTFVDIQNKSFNKMPQNAVKELEDRLEAEYVPFYIQDLRTNEIISFHAFLKTLTDSINPTFNTSKGFGRLDGVKLYTDTTRKVSVSFTMMATSREDFDELWFKINKLTTLVYPQWSKGTMVTDPEGRQFIQPFSQVMAGSPIVRLRIGDVIKSNYSKFNLARLHGLGSDDVSFKPKDDAVQLESNNLFDLKATLDNAASALSDVAMKAYYTLYGSPMAEGSKLDEIIKKIGVEGDGSSDAVYSLLSKFLVNGFANPLGVNAILNQLTDPDVEDIDASIDSTSVTALGNSLNAVISNKLRNGYQALTFQHLKPSTSRGYLINGEIFHIDKAMDIIILEKKKERAGNTSILGTDSQFNENAVIGSKKPYNFSETRTRYKVKIVDLSAPPELFNAEVFVYHTDIIPNYGGIYNLFVTPLLAFTDFTQAGQSLAKFVAVEAGAALGLGDDDVINLLNLGDKLLPEANQFMNSATKDGSPGNPFTAAFESNMGRGLAGVLGPLQFNWLQFPWELDYNSRAPMGVEISLALDVIHDIPPGLDHSGFNRAPLYNVGNIMKHVAGDPNGRQRSGNFSYNARGAIANRKGKIKGD